MIFSAMFSACTPEAHRGSSEQSIKVIFVRVFMAGRQLRVDGERIPGFSFRAEKPLSLKGNKKSAEEKRGVPYGAGKLRQNLCRTISARVCEGLPGGAVRGYE